MAKQEPFNPKKLESLQKEAKTFETKLASSPTAYTKKVSPTGSDLSLDAKLEKVRNNIEQLKSQKIREQWYGPSKPDEDVSAPKEGMISKGLGALSRPLYAIAGAAESALGLGSKKGLLENINANMAEKEAFGSILRKTGAPKIVSMPLGFALDVFLDPVNWATAGTAALIPRTVAGLIKGTTKGGLKAGLEAAKVGAVSNLQGKARAVMPWVAPMKTVGKIGGKLGEESAIGRTLLSGAGKYRTLTENIGKKAITGAEKYDVLMGTNVYDKLGKGIFGISDLNKGKTLGETIESGIRKMPAIGIGKFKASGDDLVDFFKYSPTEFNKVVRMKDRVDRLAKDRGIILVKEAGIEKGEDVFKSIDDFIKPGAPVTLDKGIKNQLQGVLKTGEEAVVEPVKVVDNLENATKLLDMAAEDYNVKNLIKAYEEVPMGKTGVKWYDTWLDKQKTKTVGGALEKTGLSGVAKSLGIFDKVKDWTPLNKLINANDEFLKIFKWAKVPANPASHVYATAGNTTFGWMAGLPVGDQRYMKYIYDNYQFLRGKKGFEFLKENLFNDTNTWFNMLENDPHLFKSVFGFAPETIIGRIPAGSKLPIKEVMKRFSPDMSFDDVKNVLSEAWDDIQRNLDEAVAAEIKSGKTTEEILNAQANIRKRTPYPSSIQTIKELSEKGGGKVSTFDLPSGWGASELGGGKYLDDMKAWAEKNKSKSPAHWIANNLLNTMPNHYEYIDQSFKLGNAQYLTNVGLAESSLLKLSRIVKINREDLLDPIVEGGKKLYRLTPQKAAEASAEIFMNYAAMPDYVKVLRSLPIIGSPFFSFQAAMMAKTGKTLIHNPAIFNKISFLMNEISGARTPTEKAALEEKYGAFLQSPSVVRLSKNWNIDMKNLIPYLTMNMFNPSQRKYNDTLPGVVANVIDNSPIMKHPVGQVILDYMILPAILSEADQPQGQFGQPLYPIGATMGQKAFYGARSLAETVVPGAVSYAGLTQIPLKAMGVPDEAIQFYPSYGWRQIAEATQGKSTVGALTKEEPVKKTMRELLGRSGLPLYPLNTEFLSKQNQKKLQGNK